MLYHHKSTYPHSHPHVHTHMSMRKTRIKLLNPSYIVFHTPALSTHLKNVRKWVKHEIDILSKPFLPGDAPLNEAINVSTSNTLQLVLASRFLIISPLFDILAHYQMSLVISFLELLLHTRCFPCHVFIFFLHLPPSHSNP